MTLVLQSCSHTLKFNFQAGTSRGVMTERKIWVIKIFDQDESNVFGLGECAPLEGLSEDPVALMEQRIEKLALEITKTGFVPSTIDQAYALAESLVADNFPALRFAVEVALLDLMYGGQRKIFSNGFFEGNDKIRINGLIWMGEKDFMLKQVKDKLSQGYTCLKMKIGAIDFDEECEVLAYIRSQVASDKLILRVDANGAFHTSEAIKKLEQLSAYDLHSIEQPIMRYQHEAMFLVCQKSKVPVALDEELIGIQAIDDKAKLLDFIQPQYIILKPSLLGGFKATKEWIILAENMGIGWWITSALESNIGLNAIAQFTNKFRPDAHQGLGTGQLYTNNFASPLTIKGGHISYDSEIAWDISQLTFELP